MKIWQLDQTEILQSGTDSASRFAGLAAQARDLGFDFCAYGARSPWPLTRPRVAMINNYPDPWVQQYQEHNYLAIDPTVHHGWRSTVPVQWADELFADTRPLWESARGFGLRVGWAQSCRNHDGTAGLVTLARSAEPLTESELRAREPQMMWFVQVFHSIMAADLLNANNRPMMEPLTARELEVLRWTADGKTSSEISEILNISERTVNFHIANIMAKLDAPNKLAAAVRAALMGLLY